MFVLVAAKRGGEGGGIVVQGGGAALLLLDKKKSEPGEKGQGRRRREAEVEGKDRRGSRGVLVEAGGKKGRKKGTITSG